MEQIVPEESDEFQPTWGRAGWLADNPLVCAHQADHRCILQKDGPGHTMLILLTMSMLPQGVPTEREVNNAAEWWWRV